MCSLTVFQNRYRTPIQIQNMLSKIAFNNLSHMKNKMSNYFLIDNECLRPRVLRFDPSYGQFIRVVLQQFLGFLCQNNISINIGNLKES